MDGWMVGWMVGWMDGWLDDWMDGWLDGRMVGWMDGWLDGWMDGWMDGWLDGWMDGWLDGWMEDKAFGRAIMPVAKVAQEYTCVARLNHSKHDLGLGQTFHAVASWVSVNHRATPKWVAPGKWKHGLNLRPGGLILTHSLWPIGC